MKNGEKTKPTPGLPNQIRLLEVCRFLNEQGAKYLVIGGWACNLHGLLRTTKDIDLLIPKDIANTKKVLKALESLTWGMAKELDAETVTKKPFTIIGDMPRVDLLTVAKNIKFEKALESSLKRRIEGVMVAYVNIDTLIQTKNTGRLQDKADVERLIQIKKVTKK